MYVNSILWENEADTEGNQIYNGDNSTPLVANTLIQGGVPEGASNGGGNSTGNPGFENADGPDGTVGTRDDNLMLTDGSAALDLGDNSELPEDEADLDDDGKTSERLPLDLAGGPRVNDNDADASTPAQVDAGAYEAPSDVKLPVELVALEAALEGGKEATLTWKTATETNNDRFEILHEGVEASAFEKIGERGGAGTTVEAQSYSFRTGELAVGTHRFRLRQVDTDGDKTLSDPVRVEVGVAGAHELSEAYPNPARTGEDARLRLAVSLAQSVEVAAYDALGRRVAVLFEGTLQAEDPRELRFGGAANLSSGVYFVRVTGETFRATRKLVLVR